ncbi:MAG: hypothetical protein WD267_05025 [Balneolales bacterium]
MIKIQNHGEEAVKWIIRIAIFAQCLGIARLAFSGSPFGYVMFMEWGWAHEATVEVEYYLGYLLILISISILVYPTRIVAALAAILFFGFSRAAMIDGGEPFSEWLLASHAVRFAAPIALILLLTPWKNSKDEYIGQKTVLWLMIGGLALTFLAHGIQAFLLHPHFVDYIIGSAQTLLQWRVDQSTAELLLRFIGIVDIIVVALLLISSTRQYAASWMIFWGLITALSRMTDVGFHAYYEVLIRFSHFCIPLAIIILTMLFKERNFAEKQPKKAEGIEV